MELTDIMALVKAGYTKDEIAQMEKPADPNPVPAVEPVEMPVPVAEPANPPAQVAEPVAVAQPAPVPQPAQQEAQPTMSEVMQAIAKLTGAIQANAISQSIMPMTTPVQAEDIMAEIIRPSYKGKEV